VKTRPVDETFVARAKRDAAFRTALLDEVWASIKAGDVATARGLMRTLISAGGGYARIAEGARLPEKSVIRMFGVKGNPTLANLSAVCAVLERNVRKRPNHRRAA